MSRSSYSSQRSSISTFVASAAAPGPAVSRRRRRPPDTTRSARGRMTLGDGVGDFGPLAAIRVAPGVLLAFEAADAGLELLVFGPRHEGDGELLQDVSWGGEA